MFPHRRSRGRRPTSSASFCLFLSWPLKEFLRHSTNAPNSCCPPCAAILGRFQSRGQMATQSIGWDTIWSAADCRLSVECQAQKSHQGLKSKLYYRWFISVDSPVFGVRSGMLETRLTGKCRLDQDWGGDSELRCLLSANRLASLY